MKHTLKVECIATTNAMFMRQQIGTGATDRGEAIEFSHHLGGGVIVAVGGRQYSMSRDQLINAVLELDETSPTLTDARKTPA